jgi:hypothetical protein
MTNDELRQSTIRNPHSEIRLTVYDLLGREVLNVSSGISPGGEVTIQAEQLPGCGVYLYRLIAGSTSAAGTMVRIPIRY